MAKLRAEIEVPDDAPWQVVEDAKARAEWRKIISLDERMKKTNLDGKCGSCVYFSQEGKYYYTKACGTCVVKSCLKERCQKACKTFYKKREGYGNV